ncbi:unnamed protein product [Arabis nemorensis]|uniref:Uncharacterized protein n=1 Tax=Arabis nemorensis TaxID=586526 RepID=A0A565C5X0_9BRAS|nr:unnamed protein product [Arabis nemorensis]
MNLLFLGKRPVAAEASQKLVTLCPEDTEVIQQTKAKGLFAGPSHHCTELGGKLLGSNLSLEIISHKKAKSASHESVPIPQREHMSRCRDQSQEHAVPISGTHGTEVENTRYRCGAHAVPKSGTRVTDVGHTQYRSREHAAPMSS